MRYIVALLAVTGIFGSRAYGGVVNSWVGAQLPIPLPVSGECHAGKRYSINSMDDLYDNIGDLECIFAAGQSPRVAPLGFSYGYLMTAANTAFWSPLANPIYQGDISVKTQCNGQDTVIGWMSIGGVKPSVAHWYVGRGHGIYGHKLAPKEYPLTKNQRQLLMDFGVDFNRFCPPQGMEDPKALIGFMPFYNSVWPSNQFIDMAVVVGRDKFDGGVITLNKAFIIPKHEEDGLATLLFYATKNFDPDVSNIQISDYVTTPRGPNGEKTISYQRIGVPGIFQRLDLQRLAEGINQQLAYPYIN